MNFGELFSYIKNYKKFITTGKHLEYAIVIDDKEKKVRLIFQHTVGIKDWLTNFNFPKKPYKNQVNNLWVHRGWANQYKSCNDEIMEKYISEVVKHPDYICEINGFSMGASLSQLAAEDFHFRTGIKPRLIIYGCPKPFFGKKTRDYVNSCIDVENSYIFNDVNDIVTKMVPLPFWYYIKDETKLAYSKKSFFKLFKPMIYHLAYDKEDYSKF